MSWLAIIGWLIANLPEILGLIRRFREALKKAPAGEKELLKKQFWGHIKRKEKLLARVLVEATIAKYGT